MGVFGLIAVGAALVAGGLAMSLLMGKGQESSNMKPPTMGDVSINTCSEGAVIPIIYGQVKLTANIVYYGNLRSVPIYQKIKTGSLFGGSSKQITGYKNYLDIHYVICEGPVTFVKYYNADSPTTITTIALGEGDSENPQIQCLAYTFDTGTGSLTIPYGSYAHKLEGVCNLWISGLYLGDGVLTPKTINVVVRRNLDHIASNLKGVDNNQGENPAAIIYDLLLEAGQTVAKIDSTSFEAAATYWKAQEYGLNIVVDEQQEIPDIVQIIFSQVDGTLRRDRALNKYFLKHVSASDSSVATINQEDCSNFQISPDGYNQVNTFFKANYVDHDKDYTTRTVTIPNTAAIRITGKRPESIDLFAFGSLASVSRRITELAKLLSFPRKRISFEIPATDTFNALNPGDIFTLVYTALGITSADFRISTVAREKSGTSIAITAILHAESLFDDEFSNAGNSLYTWPDYSPADLTKRKIFELPVVPGLESPVLLVLAARETGLENFFTVLISSASGSGYQDFGNLTSFATYGELTQAYPIDTYSIDQSGQLKFSIIKGLSDFDSSSITRAELFNYNRFALVNNELMAFQNVSEAGGVYTLSGVIRGLWGTTKAAHSSTDPIYIFYIGDNLLYSFPSFATLYFKLLPTSLRGGALDAGSATYFSHTRDYRYLTPRKPTRLLATRSGSTVTLEIFPETDMSIGAGLNNPDKTTDTYPHPFNFEGSFKVYDGSTTQYIENTTLQFTNAAGFTITVKHIRNGKQSPVATVVVGTSDGLYKGE